MITICHTLQCFHITYTRNSKNYYNKVIICKFTQYSIKKFIEITSDSEILFNRTCNKLLKNQLNKFLFTNPELRDLRQCFSTLGRGALLVGRQVFLILLEIRISDTNFLKIIKSLPYQLQKHP